MTRAIGENLPKTEVKLNLNFTRTQVTMQLSIYYVNTISTRYLDIKSNNQYSSIISVIENARKSSINGTVYKQFYFLQHTTILGEAIQYPTVINTKNF